MSTLDQLYRAVLKDPTDDTLRNAFADKLREEGGEVNEARADFIQIQLRLHRLAPPLPLCHTDPRLAAEQLVSMNSATGQLGPPVTPADPVVLLSGGDRREAERLRGQEDELFARHGPHALLGVDPGDCWLTPEGTGDYALRTYEQDHPRQDSVRLVTSADLRRGSRRGFFGALATTDSLWEALADSVRAVWPLEEVEIVTIPQGVDFSAGNVWEQYGRRWPGITFNPRYEPPAAGGKGTAG